MPATASQLAPRFDRFVPDGTDFFAQIGDDRGCRFPSLLNQCNRELALMQMIIVAICIIGL